MKRTTAGVATAAMIGVLMLLAGCPQPGPEPLRPDRGEEPNAEPQPEPHPPPPRPRPD